MDIIITYLVFKTTKVAISFEKYILYVQKNIEEKSKYIFKWDSTYLFILHLEKWVYFIKFHGMDQLY